MTSCLLVLLSSNHRFYWLIPPWILEFQFWYLISMPIFCLECAMILLLFGNCDFHSIPSAYTTHQFRNFLFSIFQCDASTPPIFNFCSRPSSYFSDFLMPYKFTILYNLLFVLNALFIYLFSLIIMVYASHSTCKLTYLSICFSFHDSMHLGYDVVKSFSLQKFLFFAFQFWFNSYDLSILSLFDVIL